MLGDTLEELMHVFELYVLCDVEQRVVYSGGLYLANGATFGGNRLYNTKDAWLVIGN